ncbi:MAG: class I SAM-dependent methyltransferase [Alphaproteobacteria bacterium]|nr:class I SAM-dependent methyltransferase [Alphaproteobacteria bacterium]
MNAKAAAGTGPGATPSSGLIAGNTYPKYETRNPIARHLVAGYLDAFDAMIDRADDTDILEVGCGEGVLAVRLATRLAAAGRRYRIRGIDIGADVINEARARAVANEIEIAFDCRSVHDLSPPADAADLVIACEVMEHLAAPEEALATIASLARSHVLLSVPREPLWRLLNMARGKYLGTWGNTPGHVQNWSAAQFLDLIAGHLDIVEVAAPLPWTMVLARKP